MRSELTQAVKCEAFLSWHTASVPEIIMEPECRSGFRPEFAF